MTTFSQRVPAEGIPHVDETYRHCGSVGPGDLKGMSVDELLKRATAGGAGVRAGLDFHHFVALNHPGRSAVENDCARSCGWQVVLNHLLRDEALPVLPVRWRVVQCVPTGEWLVWAGLIQGPAVVR